MGENFGYHGDYCKISCSQCRVLLPEVTTFSRNRIEIFCDNCGATTIWERDADNFHTCPSCRTADRSILSEDHLINRSRLSLKGGASLTEPNQKKDVLLRKQEEKKQLGWNW